MKFKAFAIIPRKDEIEIKPLVLCRECKHHIAEDGGCLCERYGWWHYGGEWFCADGIRMDAEEEDDG